MSQVCLVHACFGSSFHIINNPISLSIIIIYSEIDSQSTAESKG